MKKIRSIANVIIIICSSLIWGCDKDDQTTQPVNDILYTSFTCTDTNGVASTSFNVFEEFLLTFRIINNTGKDQPFSYTGIPSEIYINCQDSIVVSQYQNSAFPRMIVIDTLKNNDTLTNQWLAPSPVSGSPIYLRLGNYSARVHLRLHFYDAQIQLPQPINITVTRDAIVRKPNIYLYPPKSCSLSVRLVFPLGGSIIESDPQYNNGWDVFVEPSGKINGKYNFLFYESQVTDAFQYSKGWNVSKDSLRFFFTNHLLSCGFNRNEINDFLEYWIPRLQNHTRYLIYPQFSQEIERIIQLNVSIKPDALLRLFYVIKGTNRLDMLPPPAPISNCLRRGFTITEWGVITN